MALTQYVIQLVQVVLPREDGSVGQHLGQDAAHGPDVDGLGVALGQTVEAGSGTTHQRTTHTHTHTNPPHTNILHTHTHTHTHL